MYHKVLLIGAALLSLAGCAGEKLVGRPDLQVVQNEELPAPSRQDLILQQRSYVIGPLDRVIIDVYGAPDLSRTVQVDASGIISMPLLGDVPASGKSPAELASAISERARRFVRNPNVTVTVDAVNQVVTVDGQVTKPGLYPVLGRMTLVRAIASASGVSDYADTNFVVVYRRVNQHDMAALYDLRAIRQGLYPDPEIFPNDVVYVGESGGRRAFQAIIQGGALLVAPLVAILN
jgi:polysaccharide biosynthesis/export protein